MRYFTFIHSHVMISAIYPGTYTYLKHSRRRSEFCALEVLIPVHCLGRYRNEELSNRICKLCSSAIEDEIHFLCECPRYIDLRNNLYKNVSTHDPSFSQKDNFERFVYLMSNCPKPVSLYLSKAIFRRRNSLYINFI